ncbi:MAG TPA: FliI/YscN family ATPase [Pirellulaceae bacterium]|nr:FliI/YscN family ATPase [Pirellulaceae bacterium]HMO92873.1 FliI/YscN family ATPase [Pirellulaceae bacterium]HMP71094.1 FliI/YscN family ATPase [Pirellulaceae bacterium]
MLGLDEKTFRQVIQSASPFQQTGRIQSVNGAITATLNGAIGELCQIKSRTGRLSLAEVIGFDGNLSQIMPFATNETLQRDDEVIGLGTSMRVPVGDGVLGRVINALGEPIDDLGPLATPLREPFNGDPPPTLGRQDITVPFITGQAAIDGLLTLGLGQRVGLFAGSGVGKSTLLGQIARHASADLNVVVLVGERGREVTPFVQQALGPQGLSRSVVIVATANESPLARVRSAETGMAIAGWFRRQGKNVLLMLDSLTRFAMAQRDLGLMLGEPPTARGYTPSVFQKMAVLLERMGNADRGSVTGILTILVEGDDLNDPIADSARSILDGHIVLSRKLANAGHFPSIDILASNSRLFIELADAVHQRDAVAVRQILTQYDEVVDLLQIGAYQRGVAERTDKAVDLYPAVCKFLQQELGVPQPFALTKEKLRELAGRWN